MLARIGSTLAVLLLSACATTGTIEVNTEYAPGTAAEIASYRSYAWTEQPPGTDPQLYPPGVEKNVKDSVNRILQQRGYRLADSTDAADFMIGWHAAIDTKLDSSTIGVHYGYGPYGPYGPWGAGATAPVVYEYEVGTLVLDVADGESKKLVWRGTANARIESNVSEEEKRQRVDAGATKILERFPPKPE